MSETRNGLMPSAGQSTGQNTGQGMSGMPEQGPDLGRMSESNPLVPGSHPGSESGVDRSQGQSPWDQIYNEFQHHKAVYEKVRTAVQQTRHLRTGLDKLLTLGDMVTPEDVMQEAGRVVARGIGAREMAVLLSEMPTQGGQQLQQWLAVHDASLRNHEVMAQQALDLTRHRMGVTALQAMAAHSVGVPGTPKPSRVGGFGPRGAAGFGVQPTAPGGFGPGVEPAIGPRTPAGFGEAAGQGTGLGALGQTV
jgi:hypothetical protein